MQKDCIPLPFLCIAIKSKIMEILLSCLGMAILAAIIYLIITIKSKGAEKVDLDQKFDLLDKNVQNAVLQQLNNLSQNINQNFQSGRSELKQIQSQNLQDSQALITKLMGMVEQRMDQMGQGLGEVFKGKPIYAHAFQPCSAGKSW